MPEAKFYVSNLKLFHIINFFYCFEYIYGRHFSSFFIVFIDTFSNSNTPRQWSNTVTI